MRLLLDFGADIFVVNSEGFLPRDVACNNHIIAMLDGEFEIKFLLLIVVMVFTCLKMGTMTLYLLSFSIFTGAICYVRFCYH